MRFLYSSLLMAILCAASFTDVVAQNKNFWSPVNESSINKDLLANRYKPSAYKLFHLSEANFITDIRNAPSETFVSASNSSFIISVPNADGLIEKFKVTEAPVMDPALAIQYPGIKSYAGQGIDDPSSTIRCDVSPAGFHGMILSADRKTIYIDPVDNEGSHYIIFSRKDIIDYTKTFRCLTAGADNPIVNVAPAGILRAADDGRLRTYRLALASTGEYSQYFLDGSETTDAQRKTKVLAAMNTLMTRTNGIYERDFGIRMNLIANNDLIIYLNPLTDPWTNELNTTTQTTIDAVIGDANYDIGHLVHKEATADDNNGNAGCIGCVCVAGEKGSGFTSHVAPEGDPFIVDYTTHEMGHQFGGNHTFTFSSEGGTASQFEPGSGSTIMGYAGITGPTTDVQPHSDDYFHTRSIEQISDYIKSGTGGGACAVVTITGNTAPTANAGANFIIPRSTPFILTGSGTDVNGGDVLTYTWEQMNAGTPATTIPSATATSGPLFRSRTGTTSPSRTFPILSSVLNGTNGNTWEVLPSVARTLNFRLTVKDNHPGGGNGQTDDMTVTVNASSGPFAVTSPNTSGITWYVNDFKTITWNKASSELAPVSCANVSIQLSTDGGNTFPITLLASTPNDGTEEIQVPNNITSQARIRVMAVGNIFFDVSNNNLTIANSPTGDFVFNNPADVSVCSGTSVSSLLKTGSLASYATAINLSASGNPAGTTVTFDINPLNPGNNVTVTLNNIGSLPGGSYPITINGISGVINKSRIITFNIGFAAAPALSSPANNAIGQPPLPTFTWSAISGASSYTLQISTSNTFSTITQTVSSITSTSATLTTPLADNTVYYWRLMSINGCGTGTPSAARLFKTGQASCNTITSSDVPKLIDELGTPTITSVITIPGATGVTITDIDVVGLVGIHTYINDLRFTITSPAATSVILFDQICGSQNNFSLSLDDEAATGTFPCPPTGNVSIRPEQLLSAFDGQNSTGTWTLTVDDLANDDGGSLDGWGLRFCSIMASPLPVNWLIFTGHKEQNNSVTLLWTVNEYNNHHYEIERSADGGTFVKIGELSASNAPGTLQYVYNDAKPFTGRNYYRIKQVDIDSRSTYSVIVSVMIDKANSPWVIYPNPASDQASLLCNDNYRNMQISMFDAAGRLVHQQSQASANRGELITIPLEKIASGIYTVRVQSNGMAPLFKKIIVQ